MTEPDYDVISKIETLYVDNGYDYSKYQRHDYYVNGFTKKEDLELVKNGIYNNYDKMSYHIIEKFKEFIDINDDDVFFDLGSGMGTICFYYLHTLNLKKVVGIEYFQDLYNVSSNIRNQLDDNLKKRIEFRKENVINSDINEATIIYFGILQNLVAKPIENDILINEITKKINNSKNIRYVISLIPLNIKYKKYFEKICFPKNLKALYPHYFYIIK